MSRRKVLIVTEPNDIHATLVKLALEQKNVECELFFSADMHNKLKNNILISDKNCSWSSTESDSIEEYRYDNDFDSIWWRRPARPYLLNTVYEDGLDFVRKEDLISHDSIPYLFNDKAWWINPIASHPKTSSKIVQLKIAHQCGFKLPETLISNSLEDIKIFIKLNNPQGVIYKPFVPEYWTEGDEVKSLYTDKITLDNLPVDSMLQVLPGIYQQYVEKKYELRVTCFGSYVSAVKIDSQKHLEGQTNWRKIPGHELSLSKIKLPQSIKDKIILFMVKTGIVFGCFDFIVTPDNDIVFLGLSDQGQFLWVEELMPELCYLDIFSEFIIGKNFNFSWEKTESTVHSSDFDAEAEKIVKENMNKRMNLKRVKKVA